ncbi:MAG: FAD-binding oxidoreductase [Pseudomonadales bacterium]|nr:FAD-binding oxidoreductase [Pseudomonadales bacterium]
MRKWNGWGDEANSFPATQEAKDFLQAQLGQAEPLRDASLEEVLSRVPPSRLEPHPGVQTGAEIRVRHARGQSLPDWLAMRSGEIGVFPDGVAEPESRAEVRELLHYAREHDVVVIPYGGGTSVVGHINPLSGGRPVLTLSLARMNRLLSVDLVSQIAVFGAGTPGPDVEKQLRPHGYMLGHFPQSYELSTVGGWVASRSSGQQSMRYGRIEQLFAGGHIETLTGSLELPTLPASAAGPDLREVVMGSEGRFGIITDVALRVRPIPEHEEFHVAFCPDWDTAVACVRTMAQSDLGLSMLRLSNAEETRTHLILAGHARAVRWLERYLALRGIHEGKCMITMGLTGDRDQIKQVRAAALKVLGRFSGVSTGSLLGRRWAANRFRSPYLRESFWQLGYAIDTLETAVDWVRVPETVERIETALRQALQDERESVLVFTHLSHLYAQGSSIYTTYAFRCADTYTHTLKRWQKLKALASEALVAQGATISHQHGVGLDHAPYLAAEKGAEGMACLQALSRHFDAREQLNPGKLLPAVAKINLK